MATNNYIDPFYFTQPPPNYNPNNNTWNHNWKGGSPKIRKYKSENVPNHRNGQLYSPTVARSATAAPEVSPVNGEHRVQNYFPTTSQGYYQKRYNAGHYNSPGQYTTPPAPFPPLPAPYNSNSTVPAPGQFPNIMRSYTRKYYNKRRSESESEGTKRSKKKKKPLSQNIPQRKDWSVEDAKRALELEKEFNKRHKSQSLIIKFPDMDLNRDIVSQFHPAIENVHFQQPSTPRFCFVTLQESADPEAVIKELNKIQYGLGFLTAEYKKDREDDVNIGPEDIDPMTLYVGNLAQEVTKDDMVNAYPKQRRIDIGYAKKMKYTRYAFVSFKSVDDSIEAFQNTHATQMYSKSLIVRFRRLHGTVGMPGEPKIQMPQRSNNLEPHTDGNNDQDGINLPQERENGSLEPWEMVDVSNWETNRERYAGFIKQEPEEITSDDDENEYDNKPPTNGYSTAFMPGSLDVAFSLHKPMLQEVKKEQGSSMMSYSVGEDSNDNDSKSIVVTESSIAKIDQKPPIPNENGWPEIPLDKIKKEFDKTDDLATYDSLRLLNRKSRTEANALPDETSVNVKNEEPTPTLEPTPTPTLDEVSSESRENASSMDNEESVKVKSEQNYEEDETNEDDEDESGDSENDNDINFNDILKTLEDRTITLKKFRNSAL